MESSRTPVDISTPFARIINEALDAVSPERKVELDKLYQGEGNLLGLRVALLGLTPNAVEGNRQITLFTGATGLPREYAMEVAQAEFFRGYHKSEDTIPAINATINAAAMATTQQNLSADGINYLAARALEDATYNGMSISIDDSVLGLNDPARLQAFIAEATKDPQVGVEVRAVVVPPERALLSDFQDYRSGMLSEEALLERVSPGASPTVDGVVVAELEVEKTDKTVEDGIPIDLGTFVQASGVVVDEGIHLSGDRFGDYSGALPEIDLVENPLEQRLLEAAELSVDRIQLVNEDGVTFGAWTSNPEEPLAKGVTRFVGLDDVSKALASGQQPETDPARLAALDAGWRDLTDSFALDPTVPPAIRQAAEREAAAIAARAGRSAEVSTEPDQSSQVSVAESEKQARATYQQQNPAARPMVTVTSTSLKSKDTRDSLRGALVHVNTDHHVVVEIGNNNPRLLTHKTLQEHGITIDQTTNKLDVPRQQEVGTGPKFGR